MNSKILSVLFASALLLTGCITEYNAILPPNDTLILVVDGNIIENTDVIFHISESFSLDSPRIPEESYINNATLNIIGSNGYKSPSATNQGKGTYQIAVGELDDNMEYGIQIEYDGNIYQSALSKPLHTPEIDTVYWTQPEPLGEVSFYISTHDDTDRAKFYLWNYTEDWEITVPIYASIFYNPETNEFYSGSSTPYYYCWKKQADYKIGSTESLSENRIVDKLLYQLDPEFEGNLDRFQILYCVTVTQKAISRGAYEYYQNRQKLNEEMGGLFTPQPAELTGNITCVTNPSKKVMGYVETVKNISQKRIFVHQGQFPLIWPYWPTKQMECNCGIPPDDDDCTRNILSNDNILKSGWTYRDLYYILGYRPVDADTTGYLPNMWAPAICTDCREHGGTKDKPDFWPNDHR